MCIEDDAAICSWLVVGDRSVAQSSIRSYRGNSQCITDCSVAGQSCNNNGLRTTRKTKGTRLSIGGHPETVAVARSVSNGQGQIVGAASSILGTTGNDQIGNSYSGGRFGLEVVRLETNCTGSTVGRNRHPVAGTVGQSGIVDGHLCTTDILGTNSCIGGWVEQAHGVAIGSRCGSPLKRNGCGIRSRDYQIFYRPANAW